MSDSVQISIRRAAAIDVGKLHDLNAAMGHGKETDYFERCLERQEAGELDVYIASTDDQDVAYGLLNWQPKYGYYKAHDIPEIQDLNVLPALRRQGVATLLIEYCEKLARDKGFTQMGISVGLTSDYGPAQRLYAKLGYIPDGYGVTYDRQSVQAGEFRPVDDNLCLMMVKHIA